MSVIIKGKRYYTFDEAYDLTGKYIDESAERLHQRLLERNQKVAK